MRRKSLALLMAAVMAFGAAGCGSGKMEEAPSSAPAADAGDDAEAPEGAAASGAVS